MQYIQKGRVIKLSDGNYLWCTCELRKLSAVVYKLLRRFSANTVVKYLSHMSMGFNLHHDRQAKQFLKQDDFSLFSHFENFQKIFATSSSHIEGNCKYLKIQIFYICIMYFTHRCFLYIMEYFNIYLLNIRRINMY